MDEELEGFYCLYKEGFYCWHKFPFGSGKYCTGCGGLKLMKTQKTQSIKVRKSWGLLSPVTKVRQSKKIYARNKNIFKVSDGI